MVSRESGTAARIRLRIPVIVTVLAATAIPIELRPFGTGALGTSISASDVLANIAGYLPVGLVLGGPAPSRGLLVAVLIATLAETGQFVMVHRDPSVIDVVTNAIGAALGIAISQRFRIRSPEFRLSRDKAFVAATLACALILTVWVTSAYAPNSRGATSPGTLEGYWKLDETGGRVAIDSSGHALNGSFRNEPKRIAGVLGRAVTFDGVSDSIDLGRSTALRLVGTVTISAWINARAFPVDDAAIVSNHNGLGYQLDTTVDKGPRTIGFKLANECGQLMARYGATPLVVGTWYHVAGVYNAEARTLDVYLNGELDSGPLIGSVTGAQRSSREKVYIGRRSDLKGFEFAGSIDDVRIYSRALSKAEITAVIRGAFLESKEAPRPARENSGYGGRPAGPRVECAVQSDYEDSRLPAAAAVLGVLVAVAAVGFWPSAAWLLCAVVGVAAGLLLLPGLGSMFPLLGRSLIVLSSLAGSVSVVAGLSRDAHPLRAHDHEGRG